MVFYFNTRFAKTIIISILTPLLAAHRHLSTTNVWKAFCCHNNIIQDHSKFSNNKKQVNP